MPIFSKLSKHAVGFKSLVVFDGGFIDITNPLVRMRRKDIDPIIDHPHLIGRVSGSRGPRTWDDNTVFKEMMFTLDNWIIVPSVYYAGLIIRHIHKKSALACACRRIGLKEWECSVCRKEVPFNALYFMYKTRHLEGIKI